MLFQVTGLNENGYQDLGLAWGINQDDAAKTLGLECKMGWEFENPIGFYFYNPALPYIILFVEIDDIIETPEKLAEVAELYNEQKKAFKELFGKKYLCPPPSNN